jgi:hypothetical protein
VLDKLPQSTWLPFGPVWFGHKVILCNSTLVDCFNSFADSSLYVVWR